MIKRKVFPRVHCKFRSVLRYYLRLAAYKNPSVSERVYQKMSHVSDNRSSSFWDRELASSKAAYIQISVSTKLRNAMSATLIRHFVPNIKSLLDVGCAGGDMALAVSREGLEHYVGIDISEYAIKNALKNICENNHLQCAKFSTNDLCDYEPKCDAPFDVIVFNEVLYYLRVKDVVAQLHRYESWLASDGVFCISMKDDPKSHAIYKTILKQFEVLYGVLFQCSPNRLKKRIYVSQEHAAFILGVFRPVGLQ